MNPQAETQELFDRLGGQITPGEIRAILEARNLGRPLGGQVNGGEVAAPAQAGAQTMPRAPAPQVAEPLRAHVQLHHNEIKELLDRVERIDKHLDGNESNVESILTRVERIEEAFHSIYTILVGYMK